MRHKHKPETGRTREPGHPLLISWLLAPFACFLYFSPPLTSYYRKTQECQAFVYLKEITLSAENVSQLVECLASTHGGPVFRSTHVNWVGAVVHACSASTRESETGGSVQSHSLS